MHGRRQFLNFPHFFQSVFPSLVFLFLLNSCSQVEPKFTRDYFPERYQFEAQHSDQKEPEIKLLNGNSQINRQIIKFWLKNSYKNIYRQLHPIIPVLRSDLRDLSIFLNQTSQIYYVSWSSPEEVSLQALKKTLSCQPLSNVEIQFLFSGSIDQPFSANGLAILFISSHELLQQAGVVPVYPEILSTRLRKKNRLKPLRTVANFNLFAKKQTVPKEKTTPPGIVICRRDDQHPIKMKEKR